MLGHEGVDEDSLKHIFGHEMAAGKHDEGPDNVVCFAGFLDYFARYLSLALACLTPASL